MKTLCNLIGLLLFLGTALVAAAYWLQKKGYLKISFEYDDADGKHYSREFDEVVESTAGVVGERVFSAAADVKSKIEQGIEKVEEHLVHVAHEDSDLFVDELNI